MADSGLITASQVFWNPMSAQFHDADVKTLLNLSVLCNILTARNRSTADFLIFGLSFNTAFEQTFKGYSAYIRKPMLTRPTD